jgi:hypothetical protein
MRHWTKNATSGYPPGRLQNGGELLSTTRLIRAAARPHGSGHRVQKRDAREPSDAGYRIAPDAQRARAQGWPIRTGGTNALQPPEFRQSRPPLSSWAGFNGRRGGEFISVKKLNFRKAGSYLSAPAEFLERRTVFEWPGTTWSMTNSWTGVSPVFRPVCH